MGKSFGRELAALDAELGIALHTAVARIRRALTPGTIRSERELRALEERFAEHGVILPTARGALDALAAADPTAATTMSTAADWASRSILRSLAAEAAVAHQVWDMASLGALGPDSAAWTASWIGTVGAGDLTGVLDRNRSAEPTTIGDPISTWRPPAPVDKAATIVDPAIWQKQIAEPLYALDELWGLAYGAVLLRAPEADTLLRRLDALVPTSDIGIGRPLSGEPGLRVLGTRIAEGSIAWTVPGSPVRPAPMWVPAADGAHPWLRQLPGVLRAREFVVTVSRVWWEWLRGLWARSNRRLAAPMVSAMAELMRHLLARLVALYSTHLRRPPSASRSMPVAGTVSVAPSAPPAPKVPPAPLTPPVVEPTRAALAPSPTPATAPRRPQLGPLPSGPGTEPVHNRATPTPPAPAASASPPQRVSSVRTLSRGPGGSRAISDPHAMRVDGGYAASIARTGLLPVSKRSVRPANSGR
ncbi:hypothetical protein [Embleya sp. MST-111070]|uniref:hypothetical protein n=1 Tax=Embleya sp. MST-111070 TaxID=3398231 RepID=UPI003F73A4FC